MLEQQPLGGFKPSENAQKAAELLATTNELEFVEKDDHHPDVKWLIGLLLLLLGKKDTVDMKDPEATWKQSKSFLQEKVVAGGLGGMITASAKTLNFSPENVYRMKRYLAGNEEKLEAHHYAAMNPIAGFLAPFIKEAVESAGVIKPTPQHKYQEAQYIFELYSDYKDKISAFAKSMKLTL